MKRFLKVIPISLLLVFLTMSIYIQHANGKEPYIPVDSVALQKGLGITFHASAANPTIPQEQITSIAAQLPEAKLTNNIHYLFTEMTVPGFKCFSPQALDKNPKLKSDGYIKDLPVWLISFQGLNEPSAGPGPKVYDHETNYIVDAQTGEILMGFNYR